MGNECLATTLGRTLFQVMQLIARHLVRIMAHVRNLGFVGNDEANLGGRVAAGIRR